eukprot:39618-Rhodomonas_salina.4
MISKSGLHHQKVKSLQRCAAEPVIATDFKITARADTGRHIRLRFCNFESQGAAAAHVGVEFDDAVVLVTGLLHHVHSDTDRDPWLAFAPFDDHAPLRLPVVPFQRKYFQNFRAVLSDSCRSCRRKDRAELDLEDSANADCCNIPL